MNKLAFKSQKYVMKMSFQFKCQTFKPKKKKLKKKHLNKALFAREQYFTLRAPRGCKWMFTGAVTYDLDCSPPFPEPDAAPVDHSLLNLNKVTLH